MTDNLMPIDPNVRQSIQPQNVDSKAKVRPASNAATGSASSNSSQPLVLSPKADEIHTAIQAIPTVPTRQVKLDELQQKYLDGKIDERQYELDKAVDNIISQIFPDQ